MTNTFCRACVHAKKEYRGDNPVPVWVCYRFPDGIDPHYMNEYKRNEKCFEVIKRPWRMPLGTFTEEEYEKHKRELSRTSMSKIFKGI